PQETAEAHHRISDLAADLVDHYPLYRADSIARGIVHVRSFDLIATDEGACFTCSEVFRTCLLHRHWTRVLLLKGLNGNEAAGAAVPAPLPKNRRGCWTKHLIAVAWEPLAIAGDISREFVRVIEGSHEF